jgi:hypothetical protein
VAEVTAMRNGTLQGAYLIIAARALGLDCGPMSGFDNAGVDKASFSGTRIQSNFICSIGYGEPASVFPRNPRLSFEEAGRWVSRARWLEGDFVDPRPPASIRHRSSARPAAGNDDGFVEGLPIFLLADRIHRPKFRQQRVDQ